MPLIKNIFYTMKQIFFLLTAAVLTFAASCSENANQKSSEMTFKSEIEYDFGTLDYDGDGSYEFVFKNTGKAPLIITNVKSSCGCTVPTYPKKPVKKGDEASVKVQYDTKRVGKFSKTITVYSNAKNSPIILRVNGFVDAKEGSEETGGEGSE